MPEERRGQRRKDERHPVGKRGAGSPGFILHKQLFRSGLRSLKSSESWASITMQIYLLAQDPCMQASNRGKGHTKDLGVYTGCIHGLRLGTAMYLSKT